MLDSWLGKKGDGKVATILQEVDVEIIDDETCLGTDNKDHLLIDQMFCAGYLEGGKDACQVISFISVITLYHYVISVLT